MIKIIISNMDLNVYSKLPSWCHKIIQNSVPIQQHRTVLSSQKMPAMANHHQKPSDTEGIAAALSQLATEMGRLAVSNSRMADAMVQQAESVGRLVEVLLQQSEYLRRQAEAAERSATAAAVADSTGNLEDHGNGDGDYDGQSWTSV